MKTKIQFSIITAICCIFLAGCWDRKEINDIAFVTATGFDKKGENEYQVSVQVPLPGGMGGAGSSGGGGGTGGNTSFYVDSETGRNIRECNDRLQKRMSRSLYFAHRRVLIIGDNLAQQGFRRALDVIALQPQSRLSAYILVSKTSAAKLLNTQTNLEKIPAEAIREMDKAGLGITVKETIMDLKREGVDPLFPVVEIEKTKTGKGKEDKEELAIRRVGIFKDDKLAFITNESETAGVTWLLNEMVNKAITFPVRKDEELNVRIVEEKLRFTHKVTGNVPALTIHVDAKGTLEENEPNLIMEDKKTYEMVKRKMEKAIQKQIMDIVNHAKSEGIDPFGLGWYLYRTENRLWAEEWKRRWREMLPDVKVDIRINVDIQRLSNTGLNLEE
ncbi:Ger(x)C family spore germination protein [Priestia abyssalis]|uniref:Ger(x)C family spore germination protein n=1 Tax=Priestia abyssalis TaxID=1221450 RepID=UPI000994BC53|nr:Ger(x)C family spore germination protein [Priestia abyssalis]